MSSLVCLVRRDLQIYWQNKNQCWTGVLFYVIVLSLFAMSNEVNAAVIWTTFLLATVLSMNSIFKADYEAGVFEYLFLLDSPLPLVMLVKILVNWLATQLPLILITPLVVINMPIQEIAILVLSLSIGSIVLSLIGAIGAALTVALPQGGILLSVILLPLYVPVLILGNSCSYAVQYSLPYAGYIALLGALALGVLILAPFGVSAAIKVNMT